MVADSNSNRKLRAREQSLGENESDLYIVSLSRVWHSPARDPAEATQVREVLVTRKP